jgi:hypothetical protein
MSVSVSLCILGAVWLHLQSMYDPIYLVLFDFCLIKRYKVVFRIMLRVGWSVLKDVSQNSVLCMSPTHLGHAIALQSR